jgi:hypothetical protein
MFRTTHTTWAALLIGLIVFRQPANTQSPNEANNPVIKSADLQADVAVLRHAYEELHPGLYRYNTKAEMDAKFEALGKAFSQDRSLADAYLALSAFAAQVKCGHTYPNFFNQEKTIAAALFQGRNRVPFYFRWFDGRMVVTQDFTPDHRLPRGTEILSINGTPSPAILARLMTIARADGSNDAKRIAYLSVTGDSIYEAFDIYFPLFFPQERPSLRLTARRPPDAKPLDLEVPALTHEQRISPIKEREASRKGGNEVLFEWKYLNDGTAYLGMPTWALYDSKWDWKVWLNSKLDELAGRNAPALVVDLRGNEGGQDIGNEVLKRLVARDLRVSAYRRLVRYRQTPSDLNPWLDTWDPSFKNWGAAAVELAQSWPTAPPVPYFGLTKYDDDSAGGDVIQPAGKPFRGRVYVLMDSSNSSATFQFAQVVQQNRLGLLVGEPSGGNQRGINGGAFFFLRLPRSRIEMDLPLVGSFPLSPQADAGLTPDILVRSTVQDLIEGRDAVMEAVGNLLRM